MIYFIGGSEFEPNSNNNHRQHPNHGYEHLLEERLHGKRVKRNHNQMNYKTNTLQNNGIETKADTDLHIYRIEIVASLQCGNHLHP